jgi:hypothetical protein
VVLATVALNVITVSLLTRAPWSDWRTGLALNFFDNWLLIRFAVLRGDKLLGRFILFGVVVGMAELPAHAWLVDYTRTLDYSIGSGPMLWRSPLWMPLAWEIVAVQFGYLGLRLWERFGRVGLGIIALLGAINILLGNGETYSWWQYAQRLPSVSSTRLPHYPGEFGIALVFALLARSVQRAHGSRQSLLVSPVGSRSLSVTPWLMLSLMY